VVAGATGAPQPAAAAAFTALIGGACAGFPPAVLDAANGAAVVGVVATFLAVCAAAVAAGGPPDAAALLSHSDWAALAPAAPVLALSFVYMNVVPVVVSQLEGDVGKVRAAIFGGTALPFLLFWGWEAVCLGQPGSGGGGLGGAAVVDPLALLRSSPATGPLLDGFSLLAVGTSAVGFTLALTDFVGEALGAPARSPVPYALTLLPPLAGAVLAPGVFFSALNAAGTYGVLSLFGVLPAAMAAVERRGAVLGVPPTAVVRLLGGGAAGLAGVGGAAAAVIAGETWRAVSGALGASGGGGG
jgi:tyrosine-specific transport protein